MILQICVIVIVIYAGLVLGLPLTLFFWKTMPGRRLIRPIVGILFLCTSLAWASGLALLRGAIKDDVDRYKVYAESRDAFYAESFGADFKQMTDAERSKVIGKKDDPYVQSRLERIDKLRSKVLHRNWLMSHPSEKIETGCYLYAFRSYQQTVYDWGESNFVSVFWPGIAHIGLLLGLGLCLSVWRKSKTT